MRTLHNSIMMMGWNGSPFWIMRNRAPRAHCGRTVFG